MMNLDCIFNLYKLVVVKIKVEESIHYSYTQSAIQPKYQHENSNEEHIFKFCFRFFCLPVEKV